MDISRFLRLLLEGLSKLDFVGKIDILTEVFVFKGRAVFKKDRFLQIYYNELTGTTAFALIEKVPEVNEKKDDNIGVYTRTLEPCSLLSIWYNYDSLMFLKE